MIRLPDEVDYENQITIEVFYNELIQVY